MRIPEIQNRLYELADKHGIYELVNLADALKRRPADKIAPATSTRMTDALRDRIRAMKQDCPALSQAEIARRLYINPGRVSETLRGKRF